MFGQAWMNDDVDVEATDGPDFGVLNDGGDDLASVKSVVDGFLSQTNYSPDEVAGYVNTALQNESGTLLNKQVVAKDLAEHWEGYAQSLQEGTVDYRAVQMTAGEAQEKSVEAMSIFRNDFDVRRHLLSETVLELHESKTVPLTADTWSSLANLDEDGYFSECLGVDVQVISTAAQQAHAAVVQQESAARSSRGPVVVDFSRDVSFETEEEPLAQAATQIEAEAQSARVGAMDAHVDTAVFNENSERTNLKRKFSTGRTRGAPVTAGAVMAAPGFTESWSDSSKRKLAAAMTDYAQEQASGTESELG